MKKFPTYILNMAIVMVAILFLGMRPIRKSPGMINFKFVNFVGEQQVVLDTVKYKNELGQDFTVTNFKYYITDVKFITKTGRSVAVGKPFLVREDVPENQRWQLLLLPDGEYTSVQFNVGVDSADNCSGAQSGALDPVNGMFWAWNTGYVFLKLEGKSSFSKSPGNIFEYHIGGYKEPAKCLRTITLGLPNPLIIQEGSMLDVQVKADILEILKNPMTVDFSKLSSVTDFHHAEEFADNYKDMFSIWKVMHAK